VPARCAEEEPVLAAVEDRLVACHLRHRLRPVPPPAK
jgi:hypothetical protein